MSLTTLLGAAGTGLVGGPWLRGLVYAHTVPYGQAPRGSWGRCGTTLVRVPWRALRAVAPAQGRCPACRDRGSGRANSGPGCAISRAKSLTDPAGLCHGRSGHLVVFGCRHNTG
jgi:hypothetical protein